MAGERSDEDDARALLAAYADGGAELDADERRAVEALLDAEPARRAELADDRALLARVRALPDEGQEPAWAELERAVRARVDAEAARAGRAGRGARWATWARWAIPRVAIPLAAAAVAVVVAVGRGERPPGAAGSPGGSARTGEEPSDRSDSPAPAPRMAASPPPAAPGASAVYLDGEVLELADLDGEAALVALAEPSPEPAGEEEPGARSDGLAGTARDGLAADGVEPPTLAGDDALALGLPGAVADEGLLPTGDLRWIDALSPAEVEALGRWLDAHGPPPGRPAEGATKG